MLWLVYTSQSLLCLYLAASILIRMPNLKNKEKKETIAVQLYLLSLHLNQMRATFQPVLSRSERCQCVPLLS